MSILNNLTKLTLLSFVVILSSCGGGSGHSSSTTGGTAVFNDSEVEGIEYIIDGGASQFTGSDGKLTYPAGASKITFKIGNLTLKEDFLISDINSDSNIFPTDLVGVDRSAATDTMVIKVLQILQSLDDDGNPDNGIKITSATRSSITSTITLNSATAITALVTGAGKTLKSEKEVVDHFKKTLKKVAQIPVGLVFVNDRINSAVENQTAAFTLKAEDNDNGSITYSISGGDSASFDLDGGTLTFKTSPDFETKDSYAFVAQAINTSTVITQTMVINITNENEKSVTIASQTFATVENMALSQTIATGGDTARTLTILSGNTGSVFTLNSATGVITANENTLDFATNPTYNLVIQATGSDADNKTATITVNVADTTISLSSSSYTNNGVIATSNSGYGSNNSPQYSWNSNATPTGGYAIIMDDEVSPCGVGTSACKHWAVLNITKTMTALAEGATIGAPMVQGNNYDGSAKYEGPQPPAGATHTYKTTIYALKSGYTAPTDAAGATHSRASFEAAFASHIVAKATYSGEFKKPDAGLSYSSDTITEDGDGSVGDFTGSAPIIITLAGDEFATNVASTISVANVPGGLTLEFNRASSTTLEVTVSGAATNHAASDSVSNIEVKFTNTSFVNLSADSIPNSTKSDVKISFKDVANGTITYSGTIFTESSANDGSIDNKLTLTLSSDRNAYTYDDLSGITITNVPTGLTAVKTKTSSTVVEISLTGSATAHANANDIANLSVSFADSVFTNDEGGSIGAIANTNTTNINIDFNDAAGQNNVNKISGKITYTRLAPDLAKIANGQSTSLHEKSVDKNARGVKVEILDASDNSVLKTLTTDENGSYTADVSAATIVVRVKAELYNSPTWVVKAVDNTNSQALYSMQSQKVAINGDTTINLNAQSGSNGTEYTGTRTAAPFAILDDIYTTMKKVLVNNNEIGGLKFPELMVNWSINNVATEGDTSIGQIVSSHYNGSELFILGKKGVDTDEYDDHIIIHEWAHYFEDKLSRSDNLGGGHGGEKLDMRVAFGEGFATAFSGMITDDPHYFDSTGAADGNGSLNEEIATTTDMSDDNHIHNSGEVKGWWSEASVHNMLYQIYKLNNFDLEDVVDVMTDGQKDTLALTSIFSFITALKNNVSAEAGGNIDTMVAKYDISQITDAYGTGETHDGGNAVNLPVYATLVAGGSVTVTTTNENSKGGDDINKLGDYRFIKFKTTSANHTITVKSLAANVQPNLHYKDNPVKGIEGFVSPDDDNSTTLTYSKNDYQINTDYIFAISGTLAGNAQGSAPDTVTYTISVTQ
jgi:Raf kinase inhibitor-like YbhB/YbcL family protein